MAKRVAGESVKAVKQNIRAIVQQYSELVSDVADADVRKRLELVLEEAQVQQDLAISHLGTILEKVQFLHDRILAANRDHSLEVARLYNRLQEAEAAVAQLQKQMEQLQQEKEQLQQEKEEMKQRVLLGEVAYVVDDAVSTFVYGTSGNCVTIFDVFQDIDLADDQRQRRDAFKRFLSRHKFKPAEAKLWPNVVREVRKQVAHGTPGDKASVTTEMLEAWGSSLVGQDKQSSLQKLIELASLFSRPKLPLQRKTAAEISLMILEAGPSTDT